MGFVILMSKVINQMAMLIVSGVMIGYICSAVTDFVVTFADDADIVNLHNWSLGSFSGINWDNVKVMAIVVLITMFFVFLLSKYIPGIVGTLFSLVDKLVSSLSATVVGIAVSFVGLQSLPTQYDPYTPGMNVVVIVLFCVIPMIAWAATLIAMKGYALTGEKMKEIQAVNACRRDAVAGGMKLEEAMGKYVTMEDITK